MKYPIIFSLLTFCSALCPAAERVALVIGNNSYQHIGKLSNPQRDAAAVSASLKALNFDVETIQDATVESFYEGLENLKARATGANLVLLYFAGHGVEIEKKNYLLPVDAVLSTKAQLRTQAIALDDILDDMGKTKQAAKVAILDCCRNDPLTKSWNTSRSATGGGLAELGDQQLPSATLVMFSAGPGQVAADGVGDNSPFTASLVKHMKMPGQNIFNAFLQTSDDVSAATAKKQTPWVKFDGAGREFRDIVLTPGGAGGNQPSPSAHGMVQINMQDLTNMREELADMRQKIAEAQQNGLKPVEEDETEESAGEDSQLLAAEASMGVFLNSWFKKQASNSAEEWASDFAISPSYCYWNGTGGAPLSFLISDRQKLLNNYNRRSYEQIGKATVEWFDNYKAAILVVSFHYEYDGTKKARGNSFVTLKLRQSGSRWEITEFDEHVRKNEYASSARQVPDPQQPAPPNRGTKEMLNQFLANWLRNNASNNPDSWVSDFDTSVNYCYKSDGNANHRYLREDRLKLINKRPNRSYTITNATYNELANGSIDVTINYRYNYGGSVSGSCTTTLRVRNTGNRFVITSFDEKVNKN